MARFLCIALGSASELEYQLLLARNLKFLAPADCARLTAEAVEGKRMLAALTQKLKADG